MDVVVGVGRGATALYEEFTPRPMVARMAAAARDDPALGILTQLLDRKGLLTWVQSVGVCTDSDIANLVPRLPPLEFRQITAGILPETFLLTGFVNIVGLLTLYREVAGSSPARPAVLDFGCGCGRMLRFFTNATDGWEAYGADVHQGMARWCAMSLPGTTVEATGIEPPLPFADDHFDLIYGLSVFTHLDAEMSTTWRLELERVLAPGGVVLLTTHGLPVLRRIQQSTADQKRFQVDEEGAKRLEAELADRGVLHMVYESATIDLAQAGARYGTAFTSRRFVEENWGSPRLEVVRHLEGGHQGFHDLVVLRKSEWLLPNGPRRTAAAAMSN